MADIQEFNFEVDLLKAILWQYNNAPNLLSLLNFKKTWYDTNQTGFWEDWIANVFDLRTANDFGLQVWAIILGQSLYGNFVPVDNSNAWGFGVERKNFTRGNFATQTGGSRIYSTEIARLLLRLRYFKLVSSGTIPETNRMLKYLFQPYGTAYLADGLDMTQTYYFNFVIPSEMLYMLNNTDVLPRPSGVQSTVVGL